MSKRFEVIIPKSYYDSDYEEFEYLIRWIGRDGADYQYMLYDAEIQNRIRGEVINNQDSEMISSVQSSEQRQITLMAIDLSKNDYLIIAEMFANTYVTRILKTGLTERFAPDATSFKYRLMEGRYEIEFTLIMSDVPVWK